MAHFSEDPGLIEAFEKKVDIHEWVARKAFKIPDDQKVPKELRSKAKAVGFGTIYGKTIMGFAVDWYGHEKDFKMEVERHGKKKLVIRQKYLDKAQEFINEVFTSFGGIKKYVDYIILYCKKYGFIKTIAGRKRRLPNIFSEELFIRSGAERQTVNSKIQGSAADIIKLAMIKIEKDLEGTGAGMIIQVHDELVITSPVKEAEKVKDIVQYDMENIVKLRVEVIADPAIVNRWGEAK